MATCVVDYSCDSFDCVPGCSPACALCRDVWLWHACVTADNTRSSKTTREIFPSRRCSLLAERALDQAEGPAVNLVNTKLGGATIPTGFQQRRRGVPRTVDAAPVRCRDLQLDANWANLFQLAFS